ncbi:MAG: hypothetical protein ABW039_04900 [Sphingobium sp.]
MNDDNGQPKPTEIPENSSIDAEEWNSDARNTAGRIAFDEPKLAIAYATFRKTFPYVQRKGKDGKSLDPSEDDQAYLYLLLQATLVENAQNLYEWLQYVEEYPQATLSGEQVKLSTSPRVQSRAYYLANALTSLMTITNAPSAMIADLQSILGLHKPRAAKIRAAAQRALIDDPKASARKIARGLEKDPKKHGKDRDHTQISDDLKKGRLVRPEPPFKNRLQTAK